MGSKKYVRKKPESRNLTMFCPNAGEYILFDAGRAYHLQMNRLRSHFYSIVLSKVTRSSVFDTDYVCIEQELFNTTVYDVEGRTTAKVVENMAEEFVTKSADIDNPVEFAFQIGGTVLNRTPVSTCAYPLSGLH
jgi:hypothetical protein